MTYDTEGYRAWAARNYARRRAYRTQWAYEHRKSRATTKPCLVCGTTIPARQTYCAPCKVATREFQWIVQNRRRKQ